jgi:hypothetical protein
VSRGVLQSGGARRRKGGKGEKCGSDRWLIKLQTGGEERGRGSDSGHVVGGGREGGLAGTRGGGGP